MSNWESIYKSKLTTAAEAVKHIKSGDRVMLGHGAGQPEVLVEAMAANYKQYKDVEIFHWVTYGKGQYTKPEMEGHFRFNGGFISAPVREAVYDNRADFTPGSFHETPDQFRNGLLALDVAMVQLSPPDKHGFCSFGVSVDATKPGAEAAKIIIAEVNDQMPRTYGDSFIHVSKLDYIVETSYPLVESQSRPITEIEKRIGENCARLIDDGSTLQLGIGSVPDAVLMALEDKKDLGIHSEMISDEVVKMYAKGVITGARKTIDRGLIVVGFLAGTKLLYDFIDCNPAISMRTADYVNDPLVIMRNYKMVSINSCLQVDFTGQVCSETIDSKQYSGIGGQLDFVRGATMGKDGKSIIAIPSTAGKGKYSRIVPFLDYGSAVTTSRNDVQYIVTEYGAAQLKGKTMIQRARALIKIAHPNFISQLEEDFEKRFGRVKAVM